MVDIQSIIKDISETHQVDQNPIINSDIFIEDSSKPSNREHKGEKLEPEYEPLTSPGLLRKQLPLSPESAEFIKTAREACADIISGKDDRLIVVVGPCSIHQPQQAFDYAKRLKSIAGSFPDLFIMMRAYFEKPRTTVGWKGLINDPDLDGTCQINKGMYTARKLLRDLTDLGLPLAVELLDTISPQYLSEFISWGAIGARTTESQLHRELASGSGHPVGFKNNTDGSIGVAVDAMKAASAPHSFIGVDPEGSASIVKTRGNPNVHVILRGGKRGPNFATSYVAEASQMLLKQRPNQHPSVMIDCSHGNSEKDHHNQPKVVENICMQLREGNSVIDGVMIESNINEGRQDIHPEGPNKLKYGVSITDACVDFQSTIKVLKTLQTAVVERRALRLERLEEENSYKKPSSPINRIELSIKV